MLHDDSRAFQGFERLSQAHDARHHALGGTEVQHQYVVFLMVDDLVEGGGQLGMPSAGEAALKDGEL